LILRLIPGSSKGIADRLRILFHKTLIQRVPGRINEQCVYYVANLEALRLLEASGRIAPEGPEWNDVRNRQKQNKPPASLTLNHELMISKFHATLDLACRKSGGRVQLSAWRQGPDICDRLKLPRTRYRNGEWYEAEGTEICPHEPDAFFTLRFLNDSDPPQDVSFFYEADRRTTDTTKFRKKLRIHFHSVVVQKKHREIYGVPRIRAVLVETLDRQWAWHLRESAKHPIVSGKPSALFWFTPSEFVRPDEPDSVFRSIWATPVDTTLHSLVS
jgi:hypothetical protein